jgi:hypothetical protein
MDTQTPIKHRPYLYEATADAAWSGTNSRWEVAVKKVNIDGTLPALVDSTVIKQAAYGTETDATPIKSGDRCIETITAEGKRGLVLLGGTAAIQPFTLRVSDSKIEAWLPSVAATTQGHVLYNRQPCAPKAPLEYHVDGWVDTGLSLPAVSQSTHIFVQVNLRDGPFAYADHTVAGFTSWYFDDAGDDETATALGYGYIGKVTESGGSYIIRQHHTGQLRIDRDDGDKRVETIFGADAVRRQHTIERMSTTRGAFQLSDVNTLPAPTNRTALYIAMVQDISSVRKMRYESWADFRTALAIPEPTYEPQDPNQPWPFPPYDYDPLDPANWDDWWGTHPHSLLDDVADQTVGDDHRGGRAAANPIATGGEESINGHPYIHCNGSATRNACTGTMLIGDAAGKPSISPADRYLSDADLEDSLNWASRILFDSGSNPTLDWNAQQAAIADVPTGASADAEANATAINSILAALRAYKIIATPA